MQSRQQKKPRRQIFVFTAAEKKAAACVVAALVLGVATKHYRATHPRESAPVTARQEYKEKRAVRAANAYARSARGQREAAAAARTDDLPDAAPADDANDE